MRKILKKVFMIAALVPAAGSSFAAGEKVEIVATIFPVYDIAKAVGGARVNVSLLLPPGVEAHAFDPSPRDMVRVNKADMFVYTSRHMEPWAEDIIKGLTNTNISVVDTSVGIEFMSALGAGALGGRAGGLDPHIWLDPDNASKMADNIAKAMLAKDPAGKDMYTGNARAYKEKLMDLDRRTREMLARCENKTIIYGGHFAFGYFAKRYGLDHVSPYSGFSPDAEPTPKAIAGIIDKIRATGAKYVFFEELLDPKMARSIAGETGAKIELLSAGHNVTKNELEQGVTFFDIMERNMEKLKSALGYK
ncbi:MAG: zinc ABC transporter substrate-binding protein [Candidatus Omnitrophica bacterium]|nr:zinc ABC transporter substrate-binding protein [Candidatus Omnitrophota bacterium]